MQTKDKPRITFNVHTVVKSISFVALGLVLIHIVLQYLYLVHGVEVMSTLRGRFNLDNEISIPTWFEQTLLLLPAILGLVLAKFDKPNRIYWLLFGTLFTYLSVDEGAMIHEAFITKFRESTTDSATSGLGLQTWLIPVGIILLLLMVPFLRFVRRLPKRTVLQLSIGLAVYVFGAIVYEAFDLTYVHGDFSYAGISIAIEEGLEMAGMIITSFALLNYLRQVAPKFEIHIK